MLHGENREVIDPKRIRQLHEELTARMAKTESARDNYRLTVLQICITGLIACLLVSHVNIQRVTEPPDDGNAPAGNVAKQPTNEVAPQDR